MSNASGSSYPRTSLRRRIAVGVSVLILGILGLTTPAAASTTYTVSITLSGTTCDANTVVTTNASTLQVSTGDLIIVNLTNNVNNGAVQCGFQLSRDPFGGLLTNWIGDPTTSPTDLSSANSTGRTNSGSASFEVGTVDAVLRVVDFNLNRFNVFTTIQLAEPPSGVTQSAPPDLLQQFAIGPNDECGNVPEGVALFNVAREGGWVKSWAQWPYEGSGGFVCTRQVLYQSSTGTWVPRTSS